MGVPKGKRKLSRFEAAHHYYRLRSEVTNLMLQDFGFSEEKYRKSIERYRYAKLMSKKQIKGTKSLFKELFGKEPRWKK